MTFNPGFYPTKTMQSSTIDYNNGTITIGKIKVTSTGSGNIQLYLTADGTNWEKVTDSINHNFTNTGTDLRWKIEASSKVVTNILVEGYH